MFTMFAHDLRLARRKAGFTQRDVAHLMGCRKSLVTELEKGHRKPSLSQIVLLSVIYGRSFESLFSQEMREAEADLRSRIIGMPDAKVRLATTYHRDATIERLARRLADHQQDYEEA
jgi:transcriptional regulator with XRE-family HTH domain